METHSDLTWKAAIPIRKLLDAESYPNFLVIPDHLKKKYFISFYRPCSAWIWFSLDDT